ncbi:MAG TPA: hypothetical protein VK466_03385, partial [Terriglobales bacterium]|nr:hypothetical protein [Terriglobales bacterium]
MRKHTIAALLLVIAAALPAFAQRMGAPVHRSVSSFGRPHEEHFPRTLYLGTPLWFDDYSTRDAPAPSVIVIQSAAQPATSPRPVFEEPKPAAPLLIEWQGDRYVRRTSGPSSETNPTPFDYAAPTKGNPAARAQSVAAANATSPAHP